MSLLLNIFTDTPELGQEIFSYLCRYDDNRFFFRQLSHAFFLLPLYEKLRVDAMTPASFIEKFIPLYKIRKFHMTEHCGEIYGLPHDAFRSLRKVAIESIERTEDMHTFCQYFSRLPIGSLTIKYCKCVLPPNILGFNRLKTLHITITSKKNEQVVFDLLRANGETLQKLKISVHTGRKIDEAQLVRVIEDNLRLQTIDIRGDLFSYKMIHPMMRHIESRFRYVPERIGDLRRIMTLRMCDIRNCDLALMFSTLECLEWAGLTGLTSNIEGLEHSEEYRYKRIIWKSYQFETALEPYDGTVCDDIIITSRHLHGMSLSTFTIKGMTLSRPEIFTELDLTDVRPMRSIVFPELKTLRFENFHLNPELHDLQNLQMPKIRHLSLQCRLVHKEFTYPFLRFIAIQNSIVQINIQDLLHRHPHLKEILLFHNEWDASFDRSALKSWLDARHVDHYEHSDEW